ncbi:unnamed protein product [Leptidea sinapis]|uniref:MADF domain-containing protein n=1 Tax=Leptidea sinapis TaxID=189913 RepID=A0A5E4PS86_9NEOP|nr:unnamed protein product [Leptidea sinapis]
MNRQIKTVKLIEAVKARECLWKKNYVKNYENLIYIQQCWDEVAEIVGESIKTEPGEPSKRRSWCKIADTDKLIELVEAHEILWNRQSEDFNCKISRDAAWKVISDELDASVHDVRVAWKSIRDQVRRKIRQGDTSGTYVKRLNFLFKDNPDNDLQNRWRYLKDKAKKEAKKMASKWCYLPKMQFYLEEQDHDDDDDDHTGPVEYAVPICF